MNDVPPFAGVVAFVEVARQGAFNRASRALGLSASATSKAVARLEEHLGVKLLQRTTRSVSLTAEGESYLDGAERLLEGLRSLGHEVSAAVATPAGRLTVNAPAALARTWLVDALPAFQERWPEVAVELRHDDRIVDLAAQGVDVVIRSGRLPDSANLVARKLYDETLHVVASPGYWERAGVPKHPDELQRHRCLNFRAAQTGRVFPWAFTIDGAPSGFAFEGVFSANDGEAVARAAIAGLGVAQLPGYMARPAIDNGQLTETLADYRPSLTPITALYLDRRLVAPRVRVFIDFIRELAEGIPTP
ncbi:MAG: LysR family transcriptional regulator [Myxococcota bacterium]